MTNIYELEDVETLTQNVDREDFILEGDQYCFSWYNMPKECQCGVEKTYKVSSGTLHSRWCLMYSDIPSPG
jgi:hypothetical protein